VPVVVASRLRVPWDLAFLPDGTALVSLRDSGEVVRVGRGVDPVTVGKVPGVVAGGEGGLLGLAISPSFATDGAVFAYHSAATDNRVVRLTLAGGSLTAGDVLLSGIPKSSNHNGGRIRFGPDGLLYVGTGDAGDGRRSQDKASLSGKILRIRPDGSVPPDNPFGSRVWTFGHRNVQGLGWDASGRMFASEFGQNAYDEVNLIRPGGNYGWPDVEGAGDGGGRFVAPLQVWSTADASPSGIAVTPSGVVYVAALRGQRLWRVEVGAADTVVSATAMYNGVYGRLRAVELAPDGRLWILTSNTFRGSPTADDDRVVILPDQP
jgi:glucose/arabinose dehydrogenase